MTGNLNVNVDTYQEGDPGGGGDMSNTLSADHPGPILKIEWRTILVLSFNPVILTISQIPSSTDIVGVPAFE